MLNHLWFQYRINYVDTLMIWFILLSLWNHDFNRKSIVWKHSSIKAVILDLLTFSSNNMFVRILFEPLWWFWGMLNCMKSLLISSLIFSLLKHVFIGHDIEVCTPMWFNRLLSPFTWSSAYLSSNNISVIQIWPYIHDFDVYPTGWNHSWFHPYLFRC